MSTRRRPVLSTAGPAAALARSISTAAWLLTPPPSRPSSTRCSSLRSSSATPTLGGASQQLKDAIVAELDGSTTLHPGLPTTPSTATALNPSPRGRSACCVLKPRAVDDEPPSTAGRKLPPPTSSAHRTRPSTLASSGPWPRAAPTYANGRQATRRSWGSLTSSWNSCENSSPPASRPGETRTSQPLVDHCDQDRRLVSDREPVVPGGDGTVTLRRLVPHSTA